MSMEKDCDRGSPDCVAAVALEGASEPKLVLAASAEPMKRTIKKGRARAVLSSSYVLLIITTPVRLSPEWKVSGPRVASPYIKGLVPESALVPVPSRKQATWTPV